MEMESRRGMRCSSTRGIGVEPLPYPTERTTPSRIVRTASRSSWSWWMRRRARLRAFRRRRSSAWRRPGYSQVHRFPSSAPHHIFHLLTLLLPCRSRARRQSVRRAPVLSRHPGRQSRIVGEIECSRLVLRRLPRRSINGRIERLAPSRTRERLRRLGRRYGRLFLLETPSFWFRPLFPSFPQHLGHRYRLHDAPLPPAAR